VDAAPGTRALLVLAAAAALVASAGDLALLWVANAGNAPIAETLPAPPSGALAAGHLAGVLAIPLYAARYTAAARLVAHGDARAARWVVALGFYGSAVGAAVHGVTGVWIRGALGRGAPGGDPLAEVLAAGPFLVPLWAVVGLATTLGSVVFATSVARGRTALAPAFALATPLALTLGLVLAGAPTAWGRAFLVPAAPNLAHVVFFAALAARTR
jgi:hypothetical protein